jgi:aldose 1-epimerase
MVRQVSAGPVASVTLTLTSPDGEEGYPGTLSVTAVYSLDDANALTIAYSAVTDRPTIVNMTNHALFNMAGEAAGRATDNRLQILADGYTPIDAQLLPTGQVTPVAGTAFDFREPQVIETRVRRANDPQIVIGRGYDHNYILRGPAGGGAPRLAARLSDPKSGRVMEILSDQPGLQFYSGNNLTGVWAGKSGTLYRQGDGVALEPQRFPDTPNRPAFGSARLDPGETYRNTLVLRLITDSR